MKPIFRIEKRIGQIVPENDRHTLFIEWLGSI